MRRFVYGDVSCRRAGGRWPGWSGEDKDGRGYHRRRIRPHGNHGHGTFPLLRTLLTRSAKRHRARTHKHVDNRGIPLPTARIPPLQRGRLSAPSPPLHLWFVRREGPAQVFASHRALHYRSGFSAVLAAGVRLFGLARAADLVWALRPVSRYGDAAPAAVLLVRGADHHVVPRGRDGLHRSTKPPPGAKQVGTARVHLPRGTAEGHASAGVVAESALAHAGNLPVAAPVRVRSACAEEPRCNAPRVSTVETRLGKKPRVSWSCNKTTETNQPFRQWRADSIGTSGYGGLCSHEEAKTTDT
mmetsp:Transcript_10207/g.25068  ORF Transcript_10207/g.25068 Transcript_10207/m.25068 type:complete len:300 (-) Transcript_10207:112-1011(-)